MNEQSTNPNNPELTPDLRAVERALDDLASRDRGAAPAALEDRIFARTRAELGADRPAVIARIGPIAIGPLRLAAAVALAAVGVLAAVMVGGQPAPEAMIADAVVTEGAQDLTLALAESDEEGGADGFGAALAAVESNLDDFWSTGEEYDWLIEAVMETGSL